MKKLPWVSTEWAHETFEKTNTFACYTKSVQEQLSFLTRTTHKTMENLETCEKIIIQQLMPNLVGKDTLNPQFHEISFLHLKMGVHNIKLLFQPESCPLPCKGRLNTQDN